jgi:ABC-type multidrug transport system ATPase subunit
MEQVRSLLGVCSQHNVLIDHLTVREHLEFYAKIKGVQSAQVNDTVWVNYLLPMK